MGGNKINEDKSLKTDNENSIENKDDIQLKSFDDRKGIMETTYNYSKDLLGKATGYVENSIANAMGYVPKNSEEEAEKKKELNRLNEEIKKKSSELTSSITNTTSNIINGISKEGANIVEAFNESLDIKDSKKNLTEAIGDTTKIASDFLGTIDKALDDPELKKQIKNTTKRVADYAAIGLEAAAPALDQAGEKMVNIAEKVTDKIGTSAVKAGLDIAGTIPGVGEVIEGIRVIDDLSKAGLAAADAAAEVIGTGSDFISNTKENYKKIMDQKKMAEDRINKSLEDFKKTTENPLEGLKSEHLKKTTGGKSRRFKNKTRKYKKNKTHKFLKINRRR